MVVIETETERERENNKIEIQFSHIFNIHNNIRMKNCNTRSFSRNLQENKKIAN